MGRFAAMKAVGTQPSTHSYRIPKGVAHFLDDNTPRHAQRSTQTVFATTETDICVYEHCPCIPICLDPDDDHLNTTRRAKTSSPTKTDAATVLHPHENSPFSDRKLYFSQTDQKKNKILSRIMSMPIQLAGMIVIFAATKKNVQRQQRAVGLAPPEAPYSAAPTVEQPDQRCMGDANNLSPPMDRTHNRESHMTTGPRGAALQDETKDIAEEQNACANE